MQLGLRFALIVTAICALVAGADANTPAQRAGLKVLDLVVDKALLAEIQAMLAISEAQKAEMDRQFDVYTAEVQAIDALGWERGLDAGWREVE